MDITLQIILNKAIIKYWTCKIDKNTPNLAKKPIKGGIPAIENIIKAKLIAKAGFAFRNNIKSPSSLFNLFGYNLLFNRNDMIINQVAIPANI